MAHVILSPVKPEWQAISMCTLQHYKEKLEKAQSVGNPCCFQKLFKEVMSSNNNVPFFQKIKWNRHLFRVVAGAGAGRTERRYSTFKALVGWLC